jgi:hypothetical protein
VTGVIAPRLRFDHERDPTSSVKQSKGSRRPDPIPTLHEDRVSTEPSALTSLQMVRLQSINQSGRPDLNRGPHRPELWAKSGGVVRSACKSMGSGLGSPPLRSSAFAVDSRGFGREIDSLPNDEDADAGSLVISPARCAATARAALHVPNRRVTTLAAGRSPSARRATASPPRRRAWVRDQSYEDGGVPYRERHSRIASRTRSRAHRCSIAPGWHALQYE